MAAVLENRLGSYEKRKEQIRRYELFIETNSTDSSKKPRLEIESKKSKYKIRFPDGCVFLAACSSGSTDDVAELLKNTNTDINTTNVDGLTGLHQACINEDLDMVKFLVSKGIDINTRDNEGWTALHAASQSGFLDIAKFLIDKGAGLDLINCDCELPLDLSQCKEMTQLLEEAMKTKGIDGTKARNAEEEMMIEDIRRWTSSGVYGGTTDERTGASPLHVAAVKGYLDIMRQLIQLGANVDAVDSEGWTPIHGAAHWGQEEACRLLADNYCDLRAVNHQGNTPLDVADPNVLDLLKELLEKQQLLPERPNVTRPPNKIRKSSITRISAGQMKDLQKKNEEDEKPPQSTTLPTTEDDDSFGDSDQTKAPLVIKVEGHMEVVQNESSEVKPEKIVDEAAKPGVNADIYKLGSKQPEDVLSEDRIQFLLEERKKKLDQQRASDSNVVIMRRDIPRPKTYSEISRPKLIASDLIRRSGDPTLWRLGFRRSSNSDNDPELDSLLHLNEEAGETDEDKEMKRTEQLPSSQKIYEAASTVADRPPATSQSSSLLRPETAAALASLASSHQKSNEATKRDDANELERKLKAKRARESRRSTQGVTKEDIQRAEDTLKAAYQGLPKIDPPTSTEDPSPLTPELGSGDEQHPQTETSSNREGVVNSTVENILERWQQKKDGDGKGDLRPPPIACRGFMLGTPTLQRKEYSPDTLILYRKMSDQSESEYLKDIQQPTATSSEITPTKDPESVEDQNNVKLSAATRARRKRESRRSTGKISLEEVEVTTSDTEEADDSEQTQLQMPPSSSNSSATTPFVSPHTNTIATHSLPKAIPSTTSLPLSSTINTLSRFSSSRLIQDASTLSSPAKYSSLSNRDRWSNLSSSAWQPPQQQPANVRSSAILSSYDSSLSSGHRTETNVVVPMVDFRKLLEQEKLENDDLKKRNFQLEKELKNAQLQLDVSMATSSKGFDRIDAKEKRAAERKLSEVDEEKKLLVRKLASLEEELKKVESIKVENTKLKNENAALIRVISKLSK